jgi:alpha-methylacyl-CoA racemase
MSIAPEAGPLAGIRIIEFSSVGPGPFCCMLLADMGAEVVSIVQPTPQKLGIPKEARFNLTTRSRASIAINLKQPAGRETVLRMIRRADAMVEGYRPGVMERLGLDPDTCQRENPAIVYGRMTGWGQTGPMAMSVGHDLNYLAITGALSLIGPQGKPPSIPLNLLADLGGGGLYLALGVLAAILESKTSGKGQVVDTAMIDGVGSLLTHMFSFFASGRWVYEREMNFLDGGAPWYNTYETSDGKYVSVAAVERKFYDQLLAGMGLEPSEIPDQLARETWPSLKARFAAIFRSRTRDEWCAIMEKREACFAPVLSIAEAMQHPHLVARDNFIDVDGVLQPAPAPRFSRTPSAVRGGPSSPGRDAGEILYSWDFSPAEVEALRELEAIA